MMYHVGFKRTSWVDIRIEADGREEAEKLAWEELESDGSYGIDHANWYCIGVDKEEQ